MTLDRVRLGAESACFMSIGIHYCRGHSVNETIWLVSSTYRDVLRRLNSRAWREACEAGSCGHHTQLEGKCVLSTAVVTASPSPGVGRSGASAGGCCQRALTAHGVRASSSTLFELPCTGVSASRTPALSRTRTLYAPTLSTRPLEAGFHPALLHHLWSTTGLWSERGVCMPGPPQGSG